MGTNVEVKLQEIIQKIANNKEIECDFSKDISFADDLKFDSIDIVNLIVELESNFQVDLTDTEELLEKINHYKGVLELIQSKVEDN